MALTQRRISWTLILVFIFSIAMTIWWGFLISKIIENDFQTRLFSLRYELSQAASSLKNDKNNSNLNKLLASGMAELKTHCSIKPCIAISSDQPQRYLQPTESFRQNLKKETKKNRNIFFWEGGFLMLVLLAGSLKLSLNLSKEKKANQKQTEFLALATHELKRPANSISLILQSILRGSIKQDKQTEYIQKALNQVNNMTAQVDKLLQIQEANQHKLVSIKRYPFLNFWDNFIEKCKVEFHNDFKRFRFSKKQINKLNIALDENILTTILFNLLDNSLKYSNKQVNISYILNKNNVKIKISDSGIGFTKEELNSIGDMFFRSSRHIVQNAKGSGLGLYLIARLAKIHKFSFNIKSDGINSGSTIELSFKYYE